MSEPIVIHWLVDGTPKCEGLDGSGTKGVEVTNPFDPTLLQLSCINCIAAFNAEVRE